MGFFNDTPPIPLAAALRRYGWRLALLALEPLAAYWLGQAVGLPGLRVATAVPALLAAAWPAAFKDAPASFWLLACACWFLASLLVLALPAFLAA
jgi:hypothetical protein